MNILVCIDDTDNIESRGTGELASLLLKALEENGWGKCAHVTRHQMLVHPDIPYTSHNSSMCFAAEIAPVHLEAFTEYAVAFLTRESAEGSDPGLCIVRVDELACADDLIAFGRKAKQQVVTKDEAYSLARRLDIHLSEHGGTGLGVIGALAGTGLRMTGNDGRLRGKLKMKTETGFASVSDIMLQTGVEVVKSLEGAELDSGERIALGDHLKAVMLDGKVTLLVYPLPPEQSPEAPWQTCTKQQLKIY